MRERKKAATRRALGEAAIKLAMEHGVAHVTAESIGALADVSPRTFHNYFSSKEEAIVSVLTDRGQEMVEALRARPADEPIWDSLLHITVGMADDDGHMNDEFVAQTTFIHENAALLMQELGAMKALGERLAEIIAERTRTDAQDLYPRLQASAVAVCIAAAKEAWIANPSAGQLADHIRQAFALMRAGLPQPEHPAH
nr:TetR/AcrR family transcriptional regulator [Phytoactinopolyspora alkaliphila]